MIKNPFLKVIVTILACAFVHAVVAGVSSKNSPILTEPDGRYTFKDYLFAVYTTFVYIIIFGYWLLYLPGMIIFQIIVTYIRKSIYLHHTAIGAFSGLISISPT